MSENLVERAHDGERFALALLLALLLHGGVALLIPGEFLRPLPDFEPPLYVEFEPLPPMERIEPVEEPSDPVAPPEPAAPPEPVRTPEFASGDGNPAESPPSSAEPARTTGSATSAVPAAPSPPAVSGAPTFVPDEAPPAPVRSVDRSALESSRPSATSDFVEAELARYYEFQEEWISAREAWEERIAGTTAPGESAPVAPDAAPLEDQLRRVLEGIRRSADGDPRVVDLGGDQPSTPAADGPGGDGSGIGIGNGPDGRYRISAGSLDLSDLRLPAGFPLEYPLSCRVRVTADGVVSSARVEPPSPSQELNDRVSAWVRTWRFEPARSPGVIETSFTIILRTR